MRWLGNRKIRMISALLIAVLILSLVNMWELSEGNLTPQFVWWGTLYPKFCFFERKNGQLKISFWLAKALDWC